MNKFTYSSRLKKAGFSTVLVFVFISSPAQSTGSLSFKSESGLDGAASIKGFAGQVPDTIAGWTFSTYFSLLGNNLKQAFTKPFHMHGNEWAYAGAATAFAAALSFEDEPIQQIALNLRSNNPGVRTTSRRITEFGGLYELYSLSALGAYGFVFNKEKMKTATLLATQAYITGVAIESAVKILTVRMRPSFYPPTTQAEPSFKGPFVGPSDFSASRTHSSFPSGHTTSAFAVATVFATMYKDRPWIPVVAYGAATLVGVSRITENRHWTTDVAVGAALGYLTGKQAVHNYHMHHETGHSNKMNRLSFNLKYEYGHLMPEVDYDF